jgi:hypothetical protein
MAMAQPPDAVQARIAPYTGRTSLFLFGGITLILANLVLSPQGWAIVTALFPSAERQASVASHPTSVLDLVGQVIILGALLLVGSVSDEAGTFALVFLAALWLGFLYSHRSLFAGLLGQTTPATPPASSSGGPASNPSTNAWLQ